MPRAEWGELEDHLAGCPRCRGELARWQGLSDRLSGYLSPRGVSAAPPRSVGEILSRPVRRAPVDDRVAFGRRVVFGRRPAFRLAAAALAAVLLGSPFFSPYPARVLAQVPGVGDLFSAVAIERGLAVAYQAGLVDELDRSVTVDGLTFTVVGAYADSTQTAVIGRLKGPIPRMESLWADLAKAGHRWELVLTDSFGREYRRGSSSVDFDAKAGEQHILLQTDPLPFYVGHLRIRMALQTASLSGDWQVSFPVQRVSDRMTREVTVDQTFTSAEGVPIHLDKLVFAPSRTVLHYDFVLASDGPELKMPDWSLLADGRPLARLGGGGGGGGGPAGGLVKMTGTAAFEPTKAGEINIRFEGFSGGYQLGWKLPLREGSRAGSEGFTFQIDRLTAEDGKNVITGVVKGGGIKLDGLALLTADGQVVPVEVRSYLLNEDGKSGVYTLVAAGPADPAGATLEIARGYGTKPDSWSTVVEVPR
jgi:hypothetical protein